jgi:hypothetical protein
MAPSEAADSRFQAQRQWPTIKELGLDTELANVVRSRGGSG